MKTAAKEEVEKEDLKAWEEGRERRVGAWRDFSQRKERTEKRKKMKFGIHAPQNFAEDRPKQAKEEEGLPMGI